MDTGPVTTGLYTSFSNEFEKLAAAYQTYGKGKDTVVGMKGMTYIPSLPGTRRSEKLQKIKNTLKGKPGVWTEHARVIIPKEKMSPKALGFERSYGTPEPGSGILSSQWRRSDGLHAHEWEKHWVVHKDKHAVTGAPLMSKIKHMLGEGGSSVVTYFKTMNTPILKYKETK